jgi:hypothetical protein
VNTSAVMHVATEFATTHCCPDGHGGLQDVTQLPATHV